jgi:hypothetical protein
MEQKSLKCESKKHIISYMKPFIYGAFGVLTFCNPTPTYFVSITSGNPILCQQASETFSHGIECLSEYGMGTQQYSTPHIVTNISFMGSMVA